MKSSLEIAQEHELRPIAQIAAAAGLAPDEIEFYGDVKAKIKLSALDARAGTPDARLICVAGITPTNAGEGKTTTAVSLTQGLGHIGKRPVLGLREASLGPVFGIKGGAAGGGYTQVVPMEDLNLHFTGDFHAIGAANNLLAAMLDASILHGNPRNLDSVGVTWKRSLDVNDRALRQIAIGLGGRVNGYPRESGFDITAASEVMAILAMARDLGDLRARCAAITVGYDDDGKPVTAGDLQAAGAMAVLLRDAIKPNLVQTLEGQPCLIHAGPFANIAHGNSSLISTMIGRKLGDYFLTESGFGSDMGMEKFFDIACRGGGLVPDCVVLVATVRAVQHHGLMQDGAGEDGRLAAIEAGIANLARHLAIVAACEQPNTFDQLYPLDIPIKDKIESVATRVYGASDVTYAAAAERKIEQFTRDGLDTLPVCMAKTPLSLSADPTVLGAPTDFTLEIRDIRAYTGAGWLVPLCGDIMQMPGLGRSPAAHKIDLLPDGTIVGLF